MLYFIIGFGCFVAGVVLGYWFGLIYTQQLEYGNEHREEGNPYH